VTPDGRRAVSGSEDKTLRVWDSESGQCLRTLEGHSAEVSLSTTPHGRRAISGSADRTLRLWDLESGQCLRTLEGAGWVMSVSVTPDSRRAVSGGSDNNLRVWDMESGKCLRILEGHSEPVCSVSVTPDGRRAVSGSGDNTLRVWDLESGQCLRTLEGHSAVVLSVNVTPDGRRVVSGSGDTTLIDSPDGWRRVESRSGDKALRVWDMESGQCLRTLEGHTASVNSVNVTPDGRRAVSGSKDKTIRVWDLESGQCLGVFVTDALVIAVGNFSCRVVAGTATGEMLFLELRKFPLSAAILTARRLQGEVCKSLWSRIKAVMHIESLQKLQHLVSSYSPHYATRCSVCGNEFEWNSPQPSTLSACPHCAHAIIFNPFIVDLSDEAHEASLRCGLAHCRQAQGDYESTIAYLAALAAHLQKMGKPAEAAEFQREHDVLAAQMAAENMA
jgi:WD40 repeat protein/DNA-directed RNA polymerase subunit RPC12/RpoP